MHDNDHATSADAPRGVPIANVGELVSRSLRMYRELEAVRTSSASIRYALVEVGVEAFNLLARTWAVTEYNFVSDWGTRPIPSLLPARHFAAGPPLSAMGTLTLHF